MSRPDLPLAAAVVSAALVLAAALYWGKPAVAAWRADLAAVAALPAEVAALRREVAAAAEQVAADQAPAAAMAALADLTAVAVLQDDLAALADLPAEVKALQDDLAAVRDWLLDEAWSTEVCKQLGESEKEMKEARDRAVRGDPAEFWGIANTIQASIIQAQLGCRKHDWGAYLEARG